MSRAPRTFSNEFEGASESELLSSRPEAGDLGQRHGTLWIFLVLLAGGLALAGAVAYVYQEELQEALGLTSGAAAEPAAEEAASAATTEGDELEGSDASSGTTEAAPPPPEPMKDLSRDEAVIKGRISTRAVEKRLTGLTPKLQACLEEVRGRVPEFKGTLEVAFKVKWNGRASGYTATMDASPDAAFEACVKKLFTRGKWPRPRGNGSATIRQALQF